MGGQIGLESDPGTGSCFWFELPLREAAEAPEAGADTEVRLAAGLHVLVAEDNAVNRRVAKHLLEKLGCRVTLARDGVEALRAVAAERFDAVLMDCQMPELDGYAATAEIRRREAPGSHLPVIAFTAHAMREDRERCLAAGMDDYVSKPVSLGALRTALVRTLGPRARSAG
jgi:CheY-like chemotaxis protein